MEDKPECTTSIIQEIYNKIVKEEEEEEEEEKQQQQQQQSEVVGRATTLSRQSSNKKGRKQQLQDPKLRLYSYFDIAKEGFLHLLLWFRRVIIQDMVLAIHNGAMNHLTGHSIFKHDLFKQYSIDLLSAMDRNRRARPADQEGITDLLRISQTLEDLRFDQNNSMATLQQESHTVQQDLKASLRQTVQQEFQGLTKDLITTIIPVILDTVNQELLRQ